MKLQVGIGVLMILVLMNQVLSAQSIFFSATDSVSGSQRIFRANADGTNVSVVLTNTWNAFAIDTVNSKIYYNAPGPSGIGDIWGAAIDGSNPVQVLEKFGSISGMEFDENHNRLFVGSGHYAYTMNPDDPHLTQFNVGLNGILDIEYDQVHDRAFLANSTSLYTGDNIRSYPENGGSGTQIVSSLHSLKGIGIDPSHEYIYFAASKPNYMIQSIYRAKMDGSEQQMFIDNTQFGYSNPWDIEVVPEINAIFWTDQSLAGIWRANLDGSNPQKIISASGVRNLKVAVPEPSTFFLLSMCVMGLLAYAWQRRKY